MIDAQECIDAIKKALVDFGESPYYDKGAHEVMDMSKFDKKFKEMNVEDVRAVLEEVLEHEHGNPFVNSAIHGLDHMPEEWFSSLLESEDLAELY